MRNTRARVLENVDVSKFAKAARKSVLADHETDREETILRSQIRLMEERILKLEELNERVSAIEELDVVAQFDGKSCNTHCSLMEFCKVVLEAEKSQASSKSGAKNHVPLVCIL